MGGGGIIVFFGAYKYFFGVNPLEKILPYLEANSKATLEQVSKSDENSRIRAQQIDENNRQRLNQLRNEIQSEQRGNFEILSEQINCLIQLTIQTLTNITPIIQETNEKNIIEYNKQRNEINNFAKNAQVVLDQISQ